MIIMIEYNNFRKILNYWNNSYINRKRLLFRDKKTLLGCINLKIIWSTLLLTHCL